MVSRRSNAVDGEVAVTGAVIGMLLMCKINVQMCGYANVRILAVLMKIACECADFRCAKTLYTNHLHILTFAYLTALSISRLPGAPGAFSTFRPRLLSIRFRLPVMA
ncbi:MAG: hypothetical protein JWQ66_1156 [Mucilaginibacter sp.]|nr:hypothetical protein [Mucilaginibacter sp.]